MKLLLTIASGRWCLDIAPQPVYPHSAFDEFIPDLFPDGSSVASMNPEEAMGPMVLNMKSRGNLTHA